jgi:S-(hydroxymethyl)glutathione dehydrogenase/alcohol dehydrogenase
MNALVLREHGVTMERVQVDEPGSGEVLVRMVASGICGSDLHVFHGVSAAVSFPMVLGHEGSGIVESVGPGVVSHSPGDHVVLSSMDPCYRCDACLRGSFFHCTARSERAVRIHSNGELIPSYAGIGSMAEYAVLPAACAVKVPDDVDLGLLATTGCGVLTGVGAVMNTATPSPGDSVLVIGCGGVGLNVIQGCRLAGAGCIIAADTNPDRLKLATVFGATDVVDVTEEGLEAAVRRIAPSGVDIAFEVVGSPELIVQALDLTRIGGTCVVIGAADPTTSLQLPSRYFMMTEKHLTGSLMGHSLPQRDIPKIVELYRSGRLILDELVGDRMPFSNWTDAVAATETGRVARCLMMFNDDHE